MRSCLPVLLLYRRCACDSISCHSISCSQPVQQEENAGGTLTCDTIPCCGSHHGSHWHHDGFFSIVVWCVVNYNDTTGTNNRQSRCEFGPSHGHASSTRSHSLSWEFARVIKMYSDVMQQMLVIVRGICTDLFCTMKPPAKYYGQVCDEASLACTMISIYNAVSVFI